MMSFRYLNSSMVPMRGIMIFGVMSILSSSFIFCAALIMASTCMRGISGYEMASLHPLCPIMGLNSFCDSICSMSFSVLMSSFFARCLMAVFSVGMNSWRGGSRSLMVAGSVFVFLKMS